MKAIYNITGEIVDIEDMSIVTYKESDGTYVKTLIKNFTFIDAEKDYYTKLEHQAAIGAMHGLCANYTEFTKDNDGTLSNTEMITENARIIAHALVEKMKEERE